MAWDDAMRERRGTRLVRGNRRGIVAAIAVVAVLPSAAGGEAGPARGRHRGQKEILRQGGIEVRAKGLAERLRLRATSRTSRPRADPPVRPGHVRSGDPTALLELDPPGATASRREPRKVKVDGNGARAVKFDLRRNSAACKPRPIDLSRAGECSVITVDERADARHPRVHDAVPRRLPHGGGRDQRHG